MFRQAYCVDAGAKPMRLSSRGSARRGTEGDWRQDVNLRRRKPDSGGGVHSLGHVAHEGADVLGNLRDRGRFLVQPRVGVAQNGE